MSTATSTPSAAEVTQEKCGEAQEALEGARLQGVRTFMVRIRDGCYELLGRTIYHYERKEAEKIASTLGIPPQQLINSIEVLSWGEAQKYPIDRRIDADCDPSTTK